MKTRKHTILYLAAFALTAGISYGAVVITPTGVVASSELSAGYEAINVINGNGLNAPGDETATHGAGNGVGTMWLSSNSENTIGAFITFDLGSEMDLDGAWIWNYNQDSHGGRGYLNYDIYVGGSGDSAATTLLLEGASITREAGGSPVSAQFEAFSASDVQYVKFVSQSTGGNNVIGLSEVRFSQVPEPSAVALFGLGGLGLLARRRRQRS